MEKTLSLLVTGDKPGRLDTYVAEKALLSGTRVRKLIEEGYIIHNENVETKPGARLKEADVIHVRIPVVKESEVQKQDIPIEIIYQDKDIVVINKERGMVVHPAAGHQDGTLVNALLFHVEDLEGIGDEQRPGIVHRLDKNTSGLLIAAKTEEAHQKLMEMFRLRRIKKEYIAVVHGKLKGREGVINLPIDRDPKDRKKMAIVPGGREAVTRWKVKKSYNNYSIVSAFPETGRTHQIRVHLAYLGAPIVGDPECAGSLKAPSPIEGQALHAHRLEFPHPITGEQMEFNAPLPDDMEDLIDEIENREGSKY